MLFKRNVDQVRYLSLMFWFNQIFNLFIAILGRDPFLRVYPLRVVIGEYVDMVKAGIIDPLKVIRTALVDAAR